jgi:VWFA-related protein
VRKLPLLLFASFVASSVYSDQTEAPKPPTFFSETIEVRVINVDVVVTKDGRPATGLAREDFELYENGKLQPIANFLELRGDDTPPATTAQTPAAPQTAAQRPADPRPRNVLVFLDATTVGPASRERVLKPAMKLLHDALRPNDRVMIVSWNPGLRVEQELTTDTTAAGATLERLIRTTSTGVIGDQELRLAEHEISTLPNDYAMNKDEKGVPEKPAITVGIERAERYANKVLFEQSQRVEGIKSVIESMRGLEGRNAMLLITKELSEQPALPIFEFLDTVKIGFENGNTYNALAESERFQHRELTREVADAANSSGVTLYPISAAGLGVEHDTLGADRLGQEAVTPTRLVKHHDEALMTLQDIAARTGGAALTNSNNFQLAFDTLLSDMTTYYSLGYRAEGRQQDVVRAIQVKLKRKGYNVRTRQNFVEKSLTAEMNDAVAANLLYPIARNDLNVTMMPAGSASTAADQQVVMPVFIKVPTSTLTLIPDGKDLVGQFSTYTAFMRADGRVSAVKRQQHQIRFPADSLKRRKEITVRYDLAVDDKTQGVSLGIMDDTSHATGFAMMKLPGA